MSRILRPTTFKFVPAAPRPLIHFGKNFAKLDDAEMTANCNGASNSPKADAAVCLAANITRRRGHVSEDEIAPPNPPNTTVHR